MRKTVIDIGTNTILMLIADYNPDRNIITPLTDIQRVPRLGKGVDSNRNILPQSIEKAITILNEYKYISNEKNSGSINATATSFIRDANNKTEFIEAIKSHTGIEIEILPGESEARWTFWGGIFDKLHENIHQKITTIDIGGGSTEITTASGIPSVFNKLTLLDHPIKGKSFNIGSVRLNEKYLNNHPPSYSNIVSAEQFINDHLDKLDFDIKGSLLIGVAGTITTLGAIKLELDSFNSGKVDNMILTISDIEDILGRLTAMNLEEIYSMGNYMEGRADIIIPGTLILKCFMNKSGFEKIQVSTKGLRYGVFLREVL